MTFINLQELLCHRGSVGKPIFGEEVKAVVQLNDPTMASDELAQDILDYCRGPRNGG